jgi:hypothetical protein
MPDAITTQVATDALKPQSVSNDGVTVSRRSLADQVVAAKFVAANDALDKIAAGTHFFAAVRIVPPGAGGNNVATDY